MNRTDLIEKISRKMDSLLINQIDEAVRDIIEQILKEMESNGRVEIRGFGSFSLNYRASRVARNPRTGEQVEVKNKYIPHFKPGKELKERVDKKAKK